MQGFEVTELFCSFWQRYSFLYFSFLANKTSKLLGRVNQRLLI